MRILVLPAALALAVTTTAVGWLRGTRQAAPALIIEHVNVVPMDRERVLRDHTVLVRDGVVRELGPSGTVRAPRGAVRVDGRDKYLIPGLADMHVHLYDTEGFPSYLAHGVTTIANLHGSPPILRWRERLRAGTLEGPTLYTSGPSVNGYPPGNPLFVAVQDAEAARAVAREQRAAGYDFIKAYSFLNADVYRALVDEARRVGIPVVGHIPRQVGTNAVLASGQVNVAHVEEFFQRGELPDDSMPALARRVKDAGIAVTANLYAYADYLRSIADLPGVLADPEARYASPALFSEKIPTSNRSIRPNQQEFANFLRTQRVRFQKFVRALRDAGVPILLGTDTEVFGLPGQSAQMELRELVEAGLSPYEALAAATRNAGQFIARHRETVTRFGTIAPGMRADLVLVDGDPLADVANADKVQGVIARGRWYPPARLAAMRDSIAARTAPQRRFVVEFDSLMSKAKDAAKAAALLRQFRQQHPRAVPLAEIVWRGYGRTLYQQDKQSSNEIRSMAVEVYPDLFWAHNEMARGYLFAGDTARAMASFARSLRLSPSNFVVKDMVEKIDAARAGPTLDPVGVYTFAPITLRLAGQTTTVTPTLLVAGSRGRYTATLRGVGPDSVAAYEVVAGGDRLWAAAQFGNDALELWLRVRGDSVTGAWALGFANNGRLAGLGPRRP